MRIAILSNTSWYLFNFRINLMLALQEAGFEVFAAGPLDGYEVKIKQAGIRHLAVDLSGARLHPLKEMASLFLLSSMLRRERIDLVLSNTPKGNIYSALAAWPLRTKTLPNVSGLGRVFIDPSLLTLLVNWLYRLSFRLSPRVFFQNREDLAFFFEKGLIRFDQPVLIPGSGVDLTRFSSISSLSSPCVESEKFTFILVSRMLWDKGIGEYVKAARLLRSCYSNLRFLLLGQLDVANPSSIPSRTVEAWQAEGVVEYLGKTDDVRPFLQAADCVVLPSYREGVPRSLLEAAAMAKPVITTDAVGCRDTVEDGATGYLCQPRNAADLAEKMEKMLKLSVEERTRMGRNGRRKMEEEFDERVVIGKYIDNIREYY